MAITKLERLPYMDDVVRDGAVMCVLRRCPRQIDIAGSETHYEGPSRRIRDICKQQQTMLRPIRVLRFSRR